MSLDGVREAYDAAADGWVRGPEAVYERLALAMLARTPVPLVDARVLDVGAGTGVVSRAALTLGASVAVASDLSMGMLGRRCAGVAAAVADATRLPFADQSFDVVAAGCCLGHLPDPVEALREAGRVSGGVVASAFAPGWTHPAKSAIDQVLQGFGFVVPSWYARLKLEVEPAVDDPDALARLAEAAGLVEVDVAVVAVDAGLRTPDELVAWRFGMAHLAAFVDTLSPDVQAAARTACAAAVATAPALVIPLIVLSARS